MKELTLDTILLRRHYLVSKKDLDGNVMNNAYLNAYLLANFGINVDKPKLLTTEMVQNISDVFMLKVPASFYANPQDTKYYSANELFINQVVSYYYAYGAENSAIDLFKFSKNLPQYCVGGELKLREFKILDSDDAVDEVLFEIANAFCDYTRPFSVDELEEFKLLYKSGFVNEDRDIGCRDNIINLLPYDIHFARFLDRKDLVKLSIKMIGECSDGVYEALEAKDTQHLIRNALPLVRPCPLTKKQAKYYNKLVRSVGASKFELAEANSPHKKAIALLKAGKTVEAAAVYARSGSLLERNLRMLLSRATPVEAMQIIDMIKAKNPMVLYQLVSSLGEEADGSRVFTFYANNLLRSHKETDYEAKYRKSRLNKATTDYLKTICINKVYEYYKSLGSLGKVFINEAFYKIGVPSNTSASGKGIDVLPTGSRLPCTAKAVRTFVTWKRAFDIDSTLILIKDDGSADTISFSNYYSRTTGGNYMGIRFSGDVTSPTGTEYYDIVLRDVRAKGYRYVIQSFHGFCSALDQGEIYCGYQNKENLNTEAWDPKNIEMQFKVYGKTRACAGFAFDLETKEVVILNLMVDDDSRVVRTEEIQKISKFLNPDFLQINIGRIAEARGVVVNTPEEADVVFDDSYVTTEGQKVIRTYELEKLVSLVNEKQ